MTGILQADGTVCYTGIGCKKHPPATVEILNKDLINKFDAIDKKISNPPMDPRRRNALTAIQQYGDNIIVKNHGANFRNMPQVGLKDMPDGDIARGNCWAISQKIIDSIPAQHFNASWLDEISITSGTRGLGHTAILVGDKSGYYVIDYTARQFNQNLPFPMIETVDTWKEKIEQAYGTPFLFDDDYDEDEE
jgi:hypothetical protein